MDNQGRPNAIELRYNAQIIGTDGYEEDRCETKKDSKAMMSNHGCPRDYNNMFSYNGCQAGNGCIKCWKQNQDGDIYERN